MILHDRRVVAGIVAVGIGLLAPPLAEAVLAHRLGLAGMPVLYGFVGLSAVGTAAAAWYSSVDSWRSVLVYGVLTVGSALAMFASMLGSHAH